MVDSGYYSHASQTVALVESVLGREPLGRLINTHLHSDHCGGNALLQQRYPELATWVPSGQVQAVTEWDRRILNYAELGQYCPRFSCDEALIAGGVIELGSTGWEVHGSPGHDPHSVILFEPASGVLISADALWENGFGVVFPELKGEPGFEDVSRTLDLIEQLGPKSVIPGHGAMFSYSPAVLAKSRSRLEALAANPTRHVAHAAKVLLKFKLLEVQNQPLADFIHWAQATPYLRAICESLEGDSNTRYQIGLWCDELIYAGAARKRPGNTS
jgi:glyoxylase-like metal-dependent hydrolase (beta-lactamase superfamily II)